MEIPRYFVDFQTVHCCIHQIIIFPPITKSVVNNIMNIQEAKAIRLADYLQSLGYSPVKQQGNSLWYKSPFREESEPSGGLENFIAELIVGS